jgi:FkbM family methyltransferase
MWELMKQSIKDTRAEPYARWLIKRSCGVRMPFDLVKNEIYDRQAAELIERVLRADSNAIDIGCHKGQFLKLFFQHAPKRHHFAFEPIPHMAMTLQAELQSADVYNKALGNTRGEAAFYVIPDSPALSGLNTRTFVAPNKPRQEIVVSVERLDSMVPHDVKIDLIKIDVEGAEGLVIEGGIETIIRNKPFMIFEHGGTSSSAFGYSSADIYDLLVERCGLNISLLNNWLHGGPSMSKRAFTNSGHWYLVSHPAH